MNLFAVIAAAMCAAACLIVLSPVLWPRRRGAALPGAQAIAAAHAALAARHAAGEDIVAEEAALARQALDAVLAAAGQTPAAGPAPGRLRLAIAVLVFVPLVSLPVYWKVGAPQALDPAIAEAREEAAQQAAVAQMRTRIGELEAKLAARPDDGIGWATLGRSYAALDEFRKAADAFAKADPLLPGDAQMLADYADALAMAQGRRLAGAPAALLKRALTADPENLKALLLAGTAAFENADYRIAIGLWERVARLAPQDAELVASVRRSIDEAREKAGEKAGGKADAQAGGASPAPMAGDGKEAISGRVSLAQALAAGAAPDDTVFIFARAAQGPRMPLAAMRLKVRDLPAEFRLDDAMAMAPQARISQADQVIVTARVSKHGDPIPKPGDLEGSSAPVKPGTRGLALEIGAVLK